MAGRPARKDQDPIPTLGAILAPIAEAASTIEVTNNWCFCTILFGLLNRQESWRPAAHTFRMTNFRLLRTHATQLGRWYRDGVMSGRHRRRAKVARAAAHLLRLLAALRVTQRLLTMEGRWPDRSPAAPTVLSETTSTINCIEDVLAMISE